MKLGSIPQNLREYIGLAFGMVPTPLIDTFVGLLLAKTVMAGTSLGIFDALEQGGLSADDISACCQADPTAIEKLLRALLACGYLRWNKNRYELARVSRRWLLSSARQSLRAAVAHRELDLRVMHFDEYVRHGKIQDFHGGLESRDWRIYHEGQASHASLIIDEVVAGTPLPKNATDLFDLGGGHGLFSLAFCSRHPGLRARVFDLAAPSDVTSWPHWDPHSRVEFQVADIRTAPLPTASTDGVVISNVLHYFDEATNRDLLARAARSLRHRGVVVVVDAVRSLSSARSEQVEALLDLYFGAASGAGLWTIEQIRSWMQDAGLELAPSIAMRLLPCCKMQVGKAV
jgi:SAM-dependent methyltransferase